jgi:hypothetical protein
MHAKMRIRVLNFNRYHTSIFVSCAALAGMATRPKGMLNRVPAEVQIAQQRILP